REPCGCKIRGPEAVFWPRRACTSRAGGNWDLRVVLCIAGLNQQRDVGSARDLLRLRMVRRISPEGPTARFCGALHLSSVKSSEWLIPRILANTKSNPTPCETNGWPSSFKRANSQNRFF